MKAPQILVLIYLLAELLSAAIQFGEKKGVAVFLTNLFLIGGLLALLIWGGFFK